MINPSVYYSNPFFFKNPFKKLPPKNKFSPEEDLRLMEIIKFHGAKGWVQIAQIMGTRNARQCRERYKNYLNPELRQDPWTPEEDALLEEKFKEFGPRWNKVSKFFNKRSDNSVRNRWMMLDRHKHKHTNFMLNPETNTSSPEQVNSPPPVSVVHQKLPEPQIDLNSDNSFQVIQNVKPAFDIPDQYVDSLYNDQNTNIFEAFDDPWSTFPSF